MTAISTTTTAKARRGSVRLPGASWLAPGAIPLTAYLLALLVIPVGTLVVYSFYRTVFFGVEPAFTFANYREVLTSDLYRTLIFRSVTTALLVCAVTIPVAYGIAYAITFHVKRQVLVLVLLMAPMFASYVVRVFAWVLILGPTGFVNRGLQGIGLIDEPLRFLLHGRFAVTLTLTTLMIPLAMLPIYAALQNVPRELIGASRDLGESPRRTFTRVTLPLTSPAVVAAFVFVFLLAGADYLTPQLLGGSSGFLVGRAIADQFGVGGNIPLGGALAFVTLAVLTIAIGLVLGAARVLGIAARRLQDWEPATRMRRAGHERSRRARRRVRIPGWHLLIGVVGTVLYAPLAVVVLMSLSNSAALPIRSLSLSAYGDLLSAGDFGRAIMTSAMVAGACVIAALLIGTPAAFALARHRFRLQPLVYGLAGIPLIIPGVVVGVAMLTTLGAFGLLPGFGPTIAVHIWLSLPFVALIMHSRLQRFDSSVEEAARDLGSSPIRALRTVTLPIVAPTLFVTAILVWVWSMDEFLISNFIVGTDLTLPVYLYSQVRYGVTPTVNAVATVMMLGSLLVLMLAALCFRYLARRGNEGGDAESFAATVVSAQTSGR